jgi:putative glutamine amidotransferase
MIKIGVSACFMYPDPARAVFGHKTLIYLEKDMSLFLARKGILPILLPDLPLAELTDFLNEMDGFVFQGGADLAPETYGEAPIENGRWPGDRHRDQYELQIMDYAFKNKKPILAVCRGFQVMNVYFGGTLYQDLGLQTGTSVKHRDAEIYDRVQHEIVLEKDGLLADWYATDGVQATTLQVNSVHHQGVKHLGKNLVVDAISPGDQLIEACHYKNLDENFVVGVQWHPEFSHTLGDKVANPHPIYDHFLKAVKARRA